MEKAQSQTIYEILNRLDISYRSVSHPEAHTMEELAEAEKALGAIACKNLFLTNRQGTEFYLLLIHPSKRFRTAEVSKKLDKSRLSFGSQELLFELLGVYPGAITPMGLVFDPEHRVQVVMDKDLLQMEKMCVHPCVNTETLVMDMKDLLDRFFSYTGHQPIFLDITGEAL